ncbi:IS66 family transposase [Lactobacillus crispatus]|uniref:IS66 family transposase n=2 Tax=Lactobacillus crispatus TaxID=47770 RepID=A0A5M9Z2J0_9LACO|nr:IS66 family transposase [Lactobacillus crispatus]KRK34781.1 transposase [Lactobacillus crispatus DSM 20584 = JCM 1185 = ATCC 33820]ORE84914.1 transposase [Lactobacillus crispatus]QWW29806.1 IS66 family transposase [Lactobacillus crispatus]
MDKQVSLMNLMLKMTENVPDAAVQTITYNRKTQRRKRADLLAALPAEEVHHELGDKHCPDCHYELIEIGKQSVRQELLFIPAQLKRLDHIQHAYKCKYCSQRNLSDKIIKAAVPKAPLNHGLGSASLIAHSLYQKYEMKVPDYRQESDWKKMGLEVSRQMLNYWDLKSSQYYFKPVYDLLKQKLLMRPILHADETYYTVLESKTIKTYYWVFLSGKHDQYGITLYHHDPSRSGKVALNFLGNYPGYLHCDMWQAYEQLPKATLVGCWAHVRRKFHEAVPQQASEKSLAQKGLNYCNRMFYLEQTWENLSKQERYQLRQAKLKHQATFEHVLLDGNLELSNNKAERAVKSLVMGRKNWLFSQSFEGATASGFILSLIETAKRNGLDPEKYLNYLLQKLPNEEILDSEPLEAYLPWQEKIQVNCK